MTRNIVLSSLFLSTTAFAQLAPNSPAPLFAHMHEVNAEWHHFSGTLGNAPVAFHNDTERIAQHLHLVREHLVAHAPEGLSASQATERVQLLDALEAYADAGRFPQNHVLPYRNPVFIDPHGTACAVGQLMIESGHRALAERIDAEMELAYIREIQLPEVEEWAAHHGFTQDELAWIQPSYAPPIPWFPLGNGTNGTVDELLALANGDLVVLGHFTEAGGVACNGAARWNGSAYSAMGSLPEGTIHCAVEHNGEILVGGSFNNGSADLLSWSDAGWDSESVYASKAGEVTALLSHNGSLYAAGSSSGFAGTDHGVKIRQEGEWLRLPGELNGAIHALEHHGNYLVAGGSFTGAFLSQEDDILHIARYLDSGWRQIGDGLDGTVYDLLKYDNALYATGDMISMMGRYFGLARITEEAEQWEQLMPNLPDYIFSPLDGLMTGRALVERNGKIYIGGEFFIGEMMMMGNGVAVFHGAADEVEAYCNFMGPVWDLELINTHELVIGGASDTFYANIASTNLLTNGIADGTSRLSFSVSPNPVADVVTVHLPETMKANVPVRVLDVSGRVIDLPLERNGQQLRFNARGLASGQYHIEATDGAAIATGKFVKL